MTRPRSFRHRASGAAALVVLAAMTVSTPQPALGGNAPGQNNLICDEIGQRRIVRGDRVTAREVNFFLFDAAGRGCLDLVDRFLGEGASIAARDRFGNTPLAIAARMGEDQVVAHLLSLGAERDRENLAGSTPLLRAVDANRRRSATLLLEARADPNKPNLRGLTPLLVAAFNGNDQLVRLMLEHGADPTALDATGKGAIVYAAGKGFASIVTLLLEAGVDPNTRYGHDLTALMWAAGHSNDVPEAEGVATLELLIAAGANIEAADDRGRTALMTAAERGHAGIVMALLAVGADDARRDQDGNTAIALAVDDDVRRTIEARH